MKLTKEVLEEYTKLDREIRRLKNKLEYYRTHPLASVHGVVQSSMKEYPYAQTHMVVSGSDIKSDIERRKRVSQLVVDLASRKREYEQMMEDIDIAIENVEDLEMRSILQMKYIDGMSDADIADELGYERSTISKKIKSFTQFTF